MILRTLVTSFGINALGLANSILLSRWLGPTGRGEIAAGMLWPGLLIYLSSMGLIVATMYFASLPDSKPQVVLNNALLMSLGLSALAVPIGFFALPWLLKSQSPEVVSASRWYLLVIPLSLLGQSGSSVLQGRLKVSAVNWLRTVVPIGYLAGVIFMIAWHALTLMNVIKLHLILSSAVLVLTLLALAKFRIYAGAKVDGQLARKMLGYGCKVHAGQVSGMANVSLDQTLIAAWFPASYLGLYVVAVSSAGLSQLFAGAVHTVTAPSIGQKGSEGDRRELLLKIFPRFLGVSAAIMLAMALIIPIAIPIVFGNQFKSSIIPAEILLLASFFMGAKQVLGGAADGLGSPWLGSRANLFALPVTVVLLYVMLPAFGLMGAAVTTCAAYLCELLILVFGLRRKHGIHPASLVRFRWRDFWPGTSLRELEPSA